MFAYLYALQTMHLADVIVEMLLIYKLKMVYFIHDMRPIFTQLEEVNAWTCHEVCN